MEAAPHGDEIIRLRDIVAFLLIAVAAVPVCQRLKVSPILGFLLAGAAAGPHGLGLVKNSESVHRLAEFGVAFLLFMIGLELSFERLKAMRRLIFGLGGAQMLVTGAAIALIAWVWGNPPSVAVIVGLSLALSSTAMVMQLLIERGEIASPHGRAGFAVLLFQDLAVVPILILVAVLGTAASGNALLESLGWALVQGIAAVAAIVILGRLLLRRLFHIVAWTGNREFFMAMALLAIVGTAWGTMEAGLSLALGPFLAGLLLAETEYRHQVESDILPFRGLLLGLFFISVGMSTDFSLVMDRLPWLVASVAGLMLLKAVVAVALCRLFGMPLDQCLRTGLLLAQGGEFAFVVLGQAALQYELVPEALSQFMVIVASGSMLLTPFLPFVARALANAVRGAPEAPEEIPALADLEGHVVIAGYGRVGRTAARLFSMQGIAWVALDLDIRNIIDARARGEPVYYGDAVQQDVLERLGTGRAAAVLITLDDAETAAAAFDTVRKAWEDVPVFVRAHDMAHADELSERGAAHVVPETLEASLQLGAQVLHAAGTPMETVNIVIDRIRAERYEPVRDLYSGSRAKGKKSA